MKYTMHKEILIAYIFILLYKPTHQNFEVYYTLNYHGGYNPKIRLYLTGTSLLQCSHQCHVKGYDHFRYTGQ